MQARAPELAREWSARNSPVVPSEVYALSSKKAWWVCEAGHEWFALIRDRVRKNAGCPYCAGKLASPTNSIGASSPRAVSLWHPRNTPTTPWDVVCGSSKKYWWLCAKGHEWQAPPNHVVLKGSGCLRCVDARDSKREQECREIIERLTGFSFPKAKPTWLLSSLGYQMEFDGYSEALCVAFEHHGIQHFKFTPFLHHTTEKFERVQSLDAEKRALCVEHGVRLVEIRWDCEDVFAFVSGQIQ